MTVLNLLSKQSTGVGPSCLRGISVLDLTTSVAGPYAAQLLADFGAEVIKVEKRSTGDDSRAWGPPFLEGESLWYLSVNRNKHSITLDASHQGGRALLHRLIPKVDIVVLNLTAEADNPPQKVGTPATDLLPGQDAAMAALAAIYERKSTGRRCQIDVSMVASMVRFMTPRIVPYLGSGQAVKRSGGHDSVVTIYQVLNTANDPITLGLGSDAIWHRFWGAVGQPEFASNAQRLAARERIVEVISKLLLQRPRFEWLALFAEHRIPAGPINAIDQLAADPLLSKDGILFAAESLDGPIPQVGLGIRVNGDNRTYRSAPPRPGQDTQEFFTTHWAWMRKRSLNCQRTASFKKSEPEDPRHAIANSIASTAPAHPRCHLQWLPARRRPVGYRGRDDRHAKL